MNPTNLLVPATLEPMTVLREDYWFMKTVFERVAEERA
jgi:hypothetical protein